MEIVGRTVELAELAAAWERASAGDPQLAVLWGRRRVGKTYLLSHFARARRTVYFTATRQDSEARQLERFADHLREQLGAELGDLAPQTFPNWERALRFLIQLAARVPLLVVLDEAPRLTSGRSDFADVVSAVWENTVRDQRLMLVLTGSAVGAMEQMLGPHGGLHRRAGIERRLDPFPLREARAFQPALAADTFLEAYAACGGYPLHLRRWDPARTTARNLHDLAFTPGGLLLRDAPDIMSEDLDWRGGYERVLAAIAGGARRRSRIAGRAQQRIDYTLDRLRRAGYVRAVRPIGAAASADPMYEIGDGYLAYWFGVLRDDADLVEGGQGAAVQRRTDGRWRRHLAWVFESEARAHALRLVATELPADTVVGRWWRDETVEIDVLAWSGDRPVLVGEARWQRRALTSRDLAELRRRAGHLPAPVDEGTVYAFWSRGVPDADLGRHPEVRCFTPADLLGEAV